MATNIVLFAPIPLDLHDLAETTRQTLAILKPRTRSQSRSDDATVALAANRAMRYVEAIRLTISAAYSGFTVTEDILFLAEAVQKSSGDKEELNCYMLGMHNLARDSREKCDLALKSFKRIRREVIQLQQQLSQQVGGYNGKKRKYSQKMHGALEQDIKTLSKFVNYISAFASWWDWVKMETDFTRENLPIELQLDALRNKETVERWRDLRLKYTAYVQMVEEMEDAEPCLSSQHTQANVPPEFSQKLVGFDIPAIGHITPTQPRLEYEWKSPDIPQATAGIQGSTSGSRYPREDPPVNPTFKRTYQSVAEFLKGRGVNFLGSTQTLTKRGFHMHGFPQPTPPAWDQGASDLPPQVSPRRPQLLRKPVKYHASDEPTEPIPPSKGAATNSRASSKTYNSSTIRATSTRG